MSDILQGEKYRLYQGDCLEVMKGFPDNSVDAIVTDPPYFKVKDEWWDRQWDTAAGFIAWIGQLCKQWERILKPNGSLYVFASPKMAARVEVEIGSWFNVLNRIRWVKEAGWHNKTKKDELRSYLSPWEEIIFAEHYGADNIAKGEAGYEAKCDELRGFVFEPLRKYLADERDRAGLTTRKVAEEYQKVTGSRTVTGMAGHWFEKVQWSLPTEKNYHWLRELFHKLNHGGEYLRREYEYLRREYEYLRREYEYLRRPFSVTPEVPYTDVWDFPTVSFYQGKHPCEKPLSLLEHILKSSTREGALVLDCFAGSGSMGEACINTGRNFVGIELSQSWFEYAQKRISTAYAQPTLFENMTQKEDTVFQSNLL
jgi:site-specific DNA-methyltransferase (adenine-specific)